MTNHNTHTTTTTTLHTTPKVHVIVSHQTQIDGDAPQETTEILADGTSDFLEGLACLCAAYDALQSAQAKGLDGLEDLLEAFDSSVVLTLFMRRFRTDSEPEHEGDN